MKTASYSDFESIDIRVGTIVEADDFSNAHKPAWILQVDFGEVIGTLKCSAQLKELYSAADLIGKQILGIVNFPSKQVANIESQCLILGIVGGEEGTVLIQPDRSVTNGLRVL